MDPLASIWFSILAISLFFIATDESIAEFVSLTIDLLWVNIKRRYYMIILHPRNPITNWIMERKMKKLADELLRELKESQEATDEQ